MFKKIICTLCCCLATNWLFALPPQLANSVTSEFDFHGYSGYNIGSDKIVCPTTAAQGNPWVIRARFWDVEPQVDTALLARGFYITYCHVADLYGSPRAVERYDKFYAQMVGAGMNAKVVLEGLSRGGLIVYNWAASNADKVAAIYADAPVMDIKSWPLGKSDEDVAKLMDAYGFSSMDELMQWRGNPIDHAVALKDVPIIHVVGQADDVVAVADNTDIFKARLQDAGGRIVVIRKKGVGHHPHSLKDPTSIVDFIMVATGRSGNVCTVPQVGTEWRAGAGWSAGNDWWNIAMEIDSLCTAGADIVLLGNSITQGFGGERKLIPSKPGYDALNNALGHKRWVSAGIAGDCTQHLLWRLRNGSYGKSNANTVFITIGVNNLTKNDNPIDVANGIKAITVEAVKEFPNARIVLFGVLPYFDLATQQMVQKELDEWQKPQRVQFYDPSPHFMVNANELDKKFYIDDMLHLNDNGYAAWSAVIANIVKN